MLHIHGFGGDKGNFMYFAKYLTPLYHVVIPNLPGFGAPTERSCQRRLNDRGHQETANLMFKFIARENKTDKKTYE